MSIVSKATMRKVRGISPIIATIILIVITVVAGGFIYAYVSGMLRSGATTNVADVQSISLIPSSNGQSATLAVTIHNGGSVAITNVTITSFNGVSLSSAPKIIGSINPGSTGSASPQLTITTNSTNTYLNINVNGVKTSTSGFGGVSFVAGQTYPIVLQVTFANNAVQTISTSVTATAY